MGDVLFALAVFLALLFGLAVVLIFTAIGIELNMSLSPFDLTVLHIYMHVVVFFFFIFLSCSFSCHVSLIETSKL